MPDSPVPLMTRWVPILFWIAALTAPGVRAAEPGPRPFHGVPVAVPGHIEAEEFDLGGDGIAFHGAGPVFVNHGLPIPQGRPDAEIAVGEALMGPHRNQVWLRGGEWVGYTISVAESGSYTVLLQTDGPPSYVMLTSGCLNPTVGGDGNVVYHLKLDGFRVTPNLPADTKVVSTRIWLEAGQHQLQLALEYVSDVSALDSGVGSDVDRLRFYTFPVDWLEVVKSPVLFTPTRVAGAGHGFQDGTGMEARFGLPTQLLGQIPNGDLALLDGLHRAYRIADTHGAVRTLAGFPGNPPQDGTGSQAGFGPIVHALLAPTGDLFSLESRAAGGYRIARIDPQGVVTTLYSGTPLARMNDSVPGWMSGTTDVAVPLSRLEWNDQGELEAIGQFSEYRPFQCGPWQIIETQTIPWLARYWFVGQEAREVSLQYYVPLPPMGTPNLGEGLRLDGVQLGWEQPTGFIHPVLPGTDVVSTLRSADGTLWAMIESALCRLTPDPDAGVLSVFADGVGSVQGAPGSSIPAGMDALLKAVPGSRFSQFTRWSDGNTDNPRRVTTRRDTALTARFEVRLPEPHGIDPQSPGIGYDGYFQFKVHGDSRAYQYQFQQSVNLRDWTPAVRRGLQLKGAGSIDDGWLTASESEVWVRVIPDGAAKYFRVILQDR